MVSSFWFRKNREAPPWVKCKESLFEQVVFKSCTPSSFVAPRSTEDVMRDVESLDEQNLPYEAPSEMEKN